VEEDVFWEAKVHFQYVPKEHAKLTKKDYLQHILDPSNGVKNDQRIKDDQNQGCEDEHIDAFTRMRKKCLTFSKVKQIYFCVNFKKVKQIYFV